MLWKTQIREQKDQRNSSREQKKLIGNKKILGT